MEVYVWNNETKYSNYPGQHVYTVDRSKFLRNNFSEKYRYYSKYLLLYLSNAADCLSPFSFRKENH